MKKSLIPQNRTTNRLPQIAPVRGIWVAQPSCPVKDKRLNTALTASLTGHAICA